jgi:hypothetical protein
MLLRLRLKPADRHFQAFQFVLWAGRSPRQALDGVMFETRGEA